MARGTGLFLAFAVVAAGAISTGCGHTYAVNPIGEENDAFFDPQFLGIWKTTEGVEVLRVWQGEGSTYEVVFWADVPVEGTPPVPYHLEAHLFRIADRVFANIRGDLERTGCLCSTCEVDNLFDGLLILRLNSFVEVIGDGERLNLRLPSTEWLKARLPAISGFMRAEDVILTGSTAQLQSLLAENAAESGFLVGEDEPLLRDPRERPEPTRSQIRKWRWDRRKK